MSQKIKINLGESGVLDTETNPVLAQGRGSRELQNIGDILGTGELATQPEASQVCGDPLIAHYTTGTVTVTLGSRTVTGDSTAWMANAWTRDFFTGPDGKAYNVEYVTTDTSLTLKEAYEGATVAGGSYTIRHRVWMIAPFYSTQGNPSSQTQFTHDFTTSTEGTFANTEADGYGAHLIAATGAYAVAPSTTEYFRTTNTNYSPDQEYTKVLQRFSLSSQEVISGVWAYGYKDANADGVTLQLKAKISYNDGGEPGTTLATSSAVSLPAASASESSRILYFPFSSPLTVAASTGHIISFETYNWPNRDDVVDYYYAYIGTSVLPEAVAPLQVNYNMKKFTVVYTTGVTPGWNPTATTGERLHFSLQSWPESGTNTVTTPVIDVGTAPSAAFTASITKATQTSTDDWWKNTFLYAPDTTTDTITWTLEASADGSTSWHADAGDTAVTGSSVSSTNYHRYYRFVITMTSATGKSTPLVTSVRLLLPVSGGDQTADSSAFQVVGVGPKLLTGVSPTATALSTSEVPGPAGSWATYQRKLFWTTGGQAPRYWDGITVSPANVSALTQSDGSAGVDPPLRCDALVIHNDKMFWYGTAQYAYKELDRDDGAMTTTLTDASGAFPTTNGGYTGYRLYPCWDTYPLRWWTITSNDATTLTCAGANMDAATNSAVDLTYKVLKAYKKTLWYSDEIEPADTPTTNLLYFGDEDGGLIQVCVSMKGRLVIITDDEVWRVSGYGPATPWEKELALSEGGTLSPQSVVVSGDVLYWWSQRGIVGYLGGYSQPQVISGRWDAAINDEHNKAKRAEVAGVSCKGLLLWSYPSADSNVNDRTVIFNPATGAVSVRTFGMVSPTVVRDATTQKDVVYFQNPADGLVYSHDPSTDPSSSQSFSWKSAYVTPISPVDEAQYLYVKATVVAESDVTVSVSYAVDYLDSYVTAGSLISTSSATSGETGVNAADTAYVCRLPVEARGQSISIGFSGAASGRFRILNVEIVADPIESETYN